MELADILVKMTKLKKKRRKADLPTLILFYVTPNKQLLFLGLM